MAEKENNQGVALTQSPDFNLNEIKVPQHFVLKTFKLLRSRSSELVFT